MFYGKRGNEEKIEPVLEETEVYSCTDGSCIGWMRKDFASVDLHCPMCGSEMEKEIRELPKI
ncbi:MAG: cold-inducible protein YdjO-related protein [Bacillota bacterium]|nr:cold-inducible protein YdjO-related protein [Bacillota bacterium]